jgi:hypothetical protein
MQTKLLNGQGFRDYVHKDTESADIIWLWRTSMMKNSAIKDLLLHPKVEILALFADESHTYLRNKDSARCQAVLPVFAKVKFLVHVSGTLFPLGPKTDAQDTMFMLGGEYKKSPADSKWTTARLDKQLDELFKESYGRKINWDIRVFRTLITPFHLRRTMDSKYKATPDAQRRTWIIPRAYSRPQVQIIKPEPCRHEPKALSLMSKLTSLRHGQINFKQLKTRSTDAAMMTWFGCELYQAYKDARGKTGTHNPAAEKVIETSLQGSYPPARLSTLCGILRTIKEDQGERFVLVSENVSLISLATYVTSLDEIDG